MSVMFIHVVARHWWLVALRGVVSILFGVAAFLWPGITLVVLVAFFGAYMFVDGILALVSALRFRHEGERWVMLVLEGVIGVAIGVVTFLWPGITALAWLYTIAAWAIVTGILEIVVAARLRSILVGWVLLALAGIASIALGVALAAMPLAGLVAWVWLVGAYAIVFGILLVALAFRLRSIASSLSGSMLPLGDRTA